MNFSQCSPRSFVFQCVVSVVIIYALLLSNGCIDTPRIFPSGAAFTFSHSSPALSEMYTTWLTSSSNRITSESSKYCTRCGTKSNFVLFTAGWSFFASTPLPLQSSVESRRSECQHVAAVWSLMVTNCGCLGAHQACGWSSTRGL